MAFLNRVTPLRILLLILLVGMVGTAVASAQDDAVFRAGMAPPVVLDPALHTNDPETALNRAIYDYLVEVLPDATVSPNLATEWTISDDLLTYTFTLREGVTFHDGSPFTSADVVFTFQRLQEVTSPALNLLGEFEVSAPDANTVVFTLAAVNADFIYGVGATQALIIQDGSTEPNVIVEGDNPLVNFNGTGPFSLESFSPGARAVFTTNADYWGAPIAFGSMEHIYFDDIVAQVDALLSGELDFIAKFPAAQADRIEAADNVVLIELATSQHPVIRLRTDEGSLGEDVRVRQALKFATDREALNDILLQGRGVIGNNDPIAPVFSFFFDDTVDNRGYDPEMACALLEEAGIGTLETTLYGPNSFEYEDLAAVLEQQWESTGCFDIDIQIFEEGLYYDLSNPTNYFDVQLGITGWGDRPSPQILLREAYTASGIATGFNESRFIDEEIEALVAQANETTDPETRRQIYAQVSEIFRERGPIIIPYFAPLFGATSDRVQGLAMAPFVGRTDFRSVSLDG
ncbi:MAG: ABC transporter substrate-binding protein [Chloroflexi bacterium]|nr:ABC transporter substrate-binding protein [Chloroflexota bacterium]